MSLTLAGIKAMAAEMKRLGFLPSYRYGTVQATTGTNASIMSVTLDGDDNPTRVYNVVGPMRAGTRVFTVAIAPHGVYAIGSVNNDFDEGGWLPVGTTEAPFGANWSNLGSPFRNCAYRLRSDGNVELAGLAIFGATAAAPSTIFTLPVGYRPSGIINVSWTVSNNPATATAPTPRGLSVTTAGLVQVTHYAGVINPGPISLDGLSFALVTI